MSHSILYIDAKHTLKNKTRKEKHRKSGAEREEKDFDLT